MKITSMKASVVRLVENAVFEAAPKSRYTSRLLGKFNFKPKPTQGLIHNPPHAIQSPMMKTPKAFLPAQDPRRQLPTKEYLSEELENYPLIHGHAAPKDRTYTVTDELAAEIVKLRREAPKEWTVSKLARHFSLPQNVVNVVSGTLPTKPEIEQTPTMIERQKRRLMWLRGEF